MLNIYYYLSQNITMHTVQLTVFNPWQKSKNPLETILTNYYQSTDSKQYSIPIIGEIIPYISYNPLYQSINCKLSLQ